MGPTEWLLLGLLSMIWGGSFIFIEVAMRDVTPFTPVFGRVGLAAVILPGVCVLTGRRLPAEPGKQLEIQQLVVFGMALKGSPACPPGFKTQSNDQGLHLSVGPLAPRALGSFTKPLTIQ